MLGGERDRYQCWAGLNGRLLVLYRNAPNQIKPNQTTKCQQIENENQDLNLAKKGELLGLVQLGTS